MLSVASKAIGNVDFDLQFSEIEFVAPAEVRFSIPKRYERVDYDE